MFPFSRQARSIKNLEADTICLRCSLLNLTQPIKPQPRRGFAASRSSKDALTGRIPREGLFRKEYFSANGSIHTSPRRRAESSLLSRTELEATNGSTISVLRAPDHAPSTVEVTEEKPHRRRQRLKQAALESAPATPIPLSEPLIPPDASSRLSTLSSSLPPNSLRRMFTAYLALSKPRLSFLIVLTTTTAYSLYPVPALLLPSTTASPSLSTLTLLFLTTGTALSTASANALNMMMEPEHDAKMSRTRNRPIVRGLIGKRGALVFAGLSGALGLAGLYFGVNPTVAFLSGLNIFLYAGVYTPMKRISVLNTWVGAVVGGIPPLMGWAAAAGQSATGNGGWQELLLGEGSVGGWLLAGLLFTWQFPHFNALSWSIREEYKNAGYRMLAWVNPRMNGRVAFRYSLLFFPICAGLCWAGVTDQGFMVTSSVVNAWIVREAWRFWRNEGHKGTARGLFWAGVWQLPVLMVLAMVHKKGLWEGIWRMLTGREEGEMQDEDLWEEEARPLVGKESGTLEPAGQIL